MKTVICYTEGESRGNPGPAAAGVYITDESGAMISETADVIGNSTDDFAAFQAALLGLQTLEQEFGATTKTMAFEVRLGNELVKQQLNAEAPIKDPGLVPMFIEMHNLRVTNFPHLTLTHVSREQHTQAARLVNEALDGTS